MEQLPACLKELEVRWKETEPNILIFLNLIVAIIKHYLALISGVQSTKK